MEKDSYFTIYCLTLNALHFCSITHCIKSSHIYIYTDAWRTLGSLEKLQSVLVAEKDRFCCNDVFVLPEGLADDGCVCVW